MLGIEHCSITRLPFGVHMNFDFSKWFDTYLYDIKGFDVIDLSTSICEKTEVPGEKGYSDPDTEYKQIHTKLWVSLDIKPYYISKIVMGAHAGTHIDAPMHAKAGGASIDKIPNQYIGPARIINADETLTTDSLGSIPKNSIIVIRGKSNYKIPNEFRMQIIRSSPQLVIFGDCVNVDGVEDTIQYLNNDIPMIMGADQAAIESLEDNDLIFALPIKFYGIEAAPVRLFALKMYLSEKECMQLNNNLFSMGDDE